MRWLRIAGSYRAKPHLNTQRDNRLGKPQDSDHWHDPRTCMNPLKRIVDIAHGYGVIPCGQDVYRRCSDVERDKNYPQVVRRSVPEFNLPANRMQAWCSILLYPQFPWMLRPTHPKNTQTRHSSASVYPMNSARPLGFTQ